LIEKKIIFLLFFALDKWSALTFVFFFLMDRSLMKTKMSYHNKFKILELGIPDLTNTDV
jgi:hypothetical protein